MRKDFYKASDVLFGLRQEYIKVQKKLELLKLMTDISFDKQIIDIDYYVHLCRELDIKPEIVCFFEQNPDTLKGFIEHVKKDVLKTYIYGGNRAKLSTDENGNFNLLHNDYQAYIPELHTEQFKKTVEEIINSKLFDSGNKRNILTENEMTNISIDGSSMRLHIPKYNTIEYCADKDSLFFRCDQLIDNNFIERNLNLLIDSDELGFCQQQLIDESGVEDKKIYIENDGTLSDNAVFRIDEGEKSIRLVKKIRY